MRVLLLNQTFHPDVVSTAQHLTDLARGLQEAGHAVTVVTSRRAYDDPATQFPAREPWSGMEVYRVWSTGLGKSAKWRRAVDFASFLAACGLRLLFLKRHDVVVALTSPPLISVLGAATARLWRARFVYWVMDFNPDEAIAAGWLRAGSLSARCLERLSRFSLRSAHRIVALDRFMRDRILAKGISPDRLAVLPPWSLDDQVRFDPAGREAFRQRHGLTGKFVIMYSGNHSPCHPLDTLLQAALHVHEHADTLTSIPRPDDLRFVFVGGGSEFKKVQAFAAAHHLRNILCLPYQSLAQLSASLSAADLQVVVMGDPFVGLVHPCKVYNLLRLGLPILYLGPAASHITDLYAPPADPHLPPFYSLRHGGVTGVLDALAQLTVHPPPLPSALPTSSPLPPYSKAFCLPRFLALLS